MIPSSPLLNGDIGWIHLFILLIVAQRLIELIHANRNTKYLLENGGYETGQGHYIFFILLHSSWLIAMFVFAPLMPPYAGLPILAFIVLQLGRLWVIISLGKYWTTRIISIDAPLIKRGPYKFMKHPNYFVVALEIPLLPLTLGLTNVAVIFGILNLILLSYRIQIENKELNKRRI